jgi:glutamyl-tRNA reductase
VEVIFASKAQEETVRDIRRFLFSGSKLSDTESERYCYLHQGRDAISHLFRVGSGLDSMVVGEPQILGQLKEAYRDAGEIETMGVLLNRPLHKSFSVAKRIRTETNIGGNAVSISYAAVQLAKKIFGDLKNKKVLLVGAGEMAELAAEHLVTQGVSKVIVANRTIERAVKLARRFNGSAVALDELVQQLQVVDILISSTGSPDLVLRKEEVKPLMRQRRNRPLFLIDIAIPRDLDPKLNKLDNIYLYDIDDLRHVEAERIVSEEMLGFLQWLEGMEVTPTIQELLAKANVIREAEMEKTMHKLNGLPEKDKKSIEILCNSIVNKLLHDPILFLKANGDALDKQVKLDVVRKMFGLHRNSVE